MTGASSYIITLRDETIATSIMEERVDNGSSLAYPRGLQDQPLQAGRTYTLQVEADKPGSQPGKASFDVLTDQEANNVLKKVTYLQQLGSTLPFDQREQLVYEALDAVYTNYGLLDEAIASLMQLVEAGSQTPQVYRILGDHYVQVRQLELALEQYEKAVQLAEQAGNATELAIAQQRLSALKAHIQELQQDE